MTKRMMKLHEITLLNAYFEVILNMEKVINDFKFTPKYPIINGVANFIILE